jgi:hypothetical protein
MDSGVVQSKEVKALSSGSKKVRWIVIRNRIKNNNNKEEYAPRRATILPLAAVGGAATPLVKHDASNKKQINV